MELAARNAALVLSQDKERIKKEELRTIGAMNQVGGLIGLDGVRRIEAFDISNTSGVESVGSMVVYEDGRPKRSDYRKFKIQHGQGAERLRLHAGGADQALLPRPAGGPGTLRNRGRICPQAVSPVSRT